RRPSHRARAGRGRPRACRGPGVPPSASAEPWTACASPERRTSLRPSKLFHIRPARCPLRACSTPRGRGTCFAGSNAGMNPVDATLSAFSCVPCDEGAFAVRALGYVADAELLKGCLVMAILCGLWMSGRSPERTRDVRSRIVMTVGAAFTALCVARLLAVVLPFRARPFEMAGGDPTTAYRALE